ncbi:hypothetical protein DPX39_090055700 [Trypanosoma brucei equiperdum]|uniref:Uncharacterized protein n=1 Tax=Trypanosoma brucei equiperdum TaxID=630700 RepID=A0A3L6L3J7_9TRYP|nr:hypothetical protein DPX39_090055700 [Trypanosoma brucei equiperdum]
MGFTTCAIIPIASSILSVAYFSFPNPLASAQLLIVLFESCSRNRSVVTLFGALVHAGSDADTKKCADASRRVDNCNLFPFGFADASWGAAALPNEFCGSLFGSHLNSGFKRQTSHYIACAVKPPISRKNCGDN